MKISTICSIPNCNSNTRCKGMCIKHYKNAYYTSIRPRNTRQRNNILPVNCTILKCNNKCVALGYCTKHYRRFKKYGDPNKSPKLNHILTCSINGCNKPYKSNNLCRSHYSKQYRIKNIEKIKEKYQRNKHNMKEERRSYLKSYYSDPKNRLKILNNASKNYVKNRNKKL